MSSPIWLLVAGPDGAGNAAQFASGFIGYVGSRTPAAYILIAAVIVIGFIVVWAATRRR